MKCDQSQESSWATTYVSYSLGMAGEKGYTSGFALENELVLKEEEGEVITKVRGKRKLWALKPDMVQQVFSSRPPPTKQELRPRPPSCRSNLPTNLGLIRMINM